MMMNRHTFDPIDTTAPGQQARFREEQVATLRAEIERIRADVAKRDARIAQLEADLAFYRGELP